METTLTATPRDTARGKSGSRKVRKAGTLPAVVYGPGSAPRSISVDPRALVEMFRKSRDRNTIVQLEIEGTAVPCLVRDVQRHPVSREILHVDFLEMAADRPVKVPVPLESVGKSKGLSLGGRVMLVRRTLDVECAYDRIPKTLQIDVTELDIGDSVLVDQITAPEGVKIVFDKRFPVLTILGKARDRGAAEAEATPAAAT